MPVSPSAKGWFSIGSFIRSATAIIKAGRSMTASSHSLLNF